MVFLFSVTYHFNLVLQYFHTYLDYIIRKLEEKVTVQEGYFSL